ncbi:MAG: methyltransferase domain-containing protein [Oscillospiraceae bacterium]
MSLFICPVCGSPLVCSGESYRCKNNHSFDLSAQGYVNLLPANQKNSKLPGDDKSMVTARAAFLKKEYYGALLAELETLATGCTNSSPNVLDSGCGEGYYTEGIYEALYNSGKAPTVYGIDISKSAVRLASKRCHSCAFAVASAFHLPICSDSIDLLLNCFSPLCLSEFTRVLKGGGYFLYVVPAPEHLWELKKVLYDIPYKNELEKTPYNGYEYCKINRVEDVISLRCKEDIQNLFAMTPYFWKTPKAGRARLEALDELKTHISFDVHVYRKL